MKTYVLESEQFIPRPIDEVFAFFSRPENLEELTPTWLNFKIVEAPKTLAAEVLIRYRLSWHGVPIRWTTQIKEWNPPHRFVDVALSGPYVLWNHEHLFAPHENGTLMHDRVTYALPLGWLGVLAHRLCVRRDVERIFEFRTHRMGQLFPA